MRGMQDPYAISGGKLYNAVSGLTSPLGGLGGKMSPSFLASTSPPRVSILGTSVGTSFIAFTIPQR